MLKMTIMSQYKVSKIQLRKIFLFKIDGYAKESIFFLKEINKQTT